MSEPQSKIDAVAQKAFAEASLKSGGQGPKADAKADSGSSVDLKAVAKAVEADAPTPAKQTASSKPFVAKKKPAKASTMKKTARAAKPVSQRPVAAKKPAQPRTQPITKLKETIMATANKATTVDFTATAKDAAAEMQNRAKAAFEKGTVLTGEVTEFHKGNLEALVETGKLLASGMQDLGRTYMEDARTAADTVTEDVKKMAAIKSPTELFQLQGEIARRNFDAVVAQTSKNTEAMMKLFTDAFAPLSNRASVAVEKVSTAA